jgi:hypothetical protein
MGKFNKEKQQIMLDNCQSLIKEYGKVLENKENILLLKESDLPNTVEVIKAALKMYIVAGLSGNNITENELENLKTCFCLLSNFISNDELKEFIELENVTLKDLTIDNSIHKLGIYSKLLSFQKERFKTNMEEIHIFIDNINNTLKKIRET